MRRTFQGSLVAMVTPFRDGKVDESKLRDLVEFHVAHGTDGLVPCGTTGESPTLTHEEHKRVVEIVIEQSRGRIPVVAGTGSNSMVEAIEILTGISGSGDGVAHLAHVGGMMVGFAYLRWWRDGSPGGRLLARWRRRRLEVVPGGAGRAARSSRTREAEIDRILDKISEHGLGSLTPEEERILDEASRRPERD